MNNSGVDDSLDIPDTVKGVKGMQVKFICRGVGIIHLQCHPKIKNCSLDII